MGIVAMLPVYRQRSVKSADALRLKLKETAMDVRGYPTCFRKALAISIVAALCSGMPVPASAMPNMPHAFAKHEVASCSGDVAHTSMRYQYRNSSRGYAGDAAGSYGHEPSSRWYP
jgi:hypothetical protein